MAEEEGRKGCKNDQQLLCFSEPVVECELTGNLSPRLPRMHTHTGTKIQHSAALITGHFIGPGNEEEQAHCMPKQAPQPGVASGS